MTDNPTGKEPNSVEIITRYEGGTEMYSVDAGKTWETKDKFKQPDPIMQILEDLLDYHLDGIDFITRTTYGMDMTSVGDTIGDAIQQAHQQLEAYVAEAVRLGKIEELKALQPIPTFLYSTRNDPDKLTAAIERTRDASLHVIERISELEGQEAG